MIASIKTNQSTAPLSTPSFESLMPVMTVRFRKATCSSLTSREARDEAIAEMTAIAFGLYTSLVRRNKIASIFANSLASYSIYAYYNGRRFAGMSGTDVSSPRTQILERSTVINNITKENYICPKTHRPSTLGAFNIDFKAWTKTLGKKKRQILLAILDGETTSDLAKKYKITRGRISQIRKELYDSWLEFTADTVKEEEEVCVMNQY